MIDLFFGEDDFFDMSKDNSMETTKKTTIKPVYLPLCTSSIIMADKSFPMRLYAKLTLDSNYNSNKKEEHRYIYHSKIRSEGFQQDLQEMNISKSTYTRQIKKLREYNELVDMQETQDGVVYKLHYRNIGSGKFVCIRQDVLQELLKETNDTAFKIYLILLYALRDNDSNRYIEKQITREWLLNKLGLKSSSRQCITDGLKLLDGKYIKVRKVTETKDTINKNGTITVTTVTKNFISLIDQELKAPFFVGRKVHILTVKYRLIT